MSVYKKVISLLTGFLFISQSALAENFDEFKENLKKSTQPLKIYEEQIASCNKDINDFKKQNKEASLGLSQEIAIINKLEKDSNDYSIKINILADNIQLSTDNYKEVELLNHVKNQLMKNGLRLIYENKELKNFPAVNTVTHVIVLKKDNFDFTNEQHKINNFLYNIDKLYSNNLTCYDEIFSDEDKNFQSSEIDKNSRKNYQNLEQNFLILFPHKSNSTISLLKSMIIANKEANNVSSYHEQKKYLDQEIAQYDIEQQKQLYEIFNILKENKLSKPLYEGTSYKQEISNLYTQLYSWKVKQQNKVKYYLIIN